MPRPVTPLSQASVPLPVALRAHFSKPLAKLPKALRDLVHAEFFSPWDELSPSRRKEIAEFLDQLCDANTKRDAASLQRVFDQREALQNELRDLHGLATSTESERTHQLVRKGALEQELARLDAYIQQSRGDYPPRSIDDERTRSSFTCISHPQAARRLTERYQARPCEMAAWVFLGSAAGGFTAYVPSNEGLEPACFRFGYEMADDYISPLFGCVFDGEEIDRFQPTDRYITGADLLERWTLAFKGDAEPFIRAMVIQSRLTDLHPIWQRTACAHPENPGFPPLTTGLFSITQIEQIETEESLQPVAATKASGPAGAGEAPATVTRPAPDQTDPCAVFRQMPALEARELSLNFVGDTSETGLSANNLLEISAREVTRRIPLAAFELADRRSGSLNQQGAILVGLAQGRKISRADEKLAASVKRLRSILRKHLGIVGDPFMPHSSQTGWQPLFSVRDSRGASDRRAQEDAERRTVSFDQFMEAGHQFADDSSSQDEQADDLDEADRWLKKNDPGHRS